MEKQLLIGDNSFLGISHLSQARGRERRLTLRTKDKVNLIEKAASCGATGFTFTADPSNFTVLKSLESSKLIQDNFGVFPVLPYAARYVRAVNEKGITGLIDSIMSQLSVAERAKLIVRGSLSTITFDPLGALIAYIDAELAQIGRKHNLRAVLLHEVITDLGASFGATDILQAFCEHIKDKWHATPGFVTRNFPKLVDLLRQTSLSISEVTIMTPFNQIGFQMNPTKESCETCLAGMNARTVIGMSILAGGYLKLDESLEYLRKLQNLSGVTIGVSSVEHALDTFSKLKHVL